MMLISGHACSANSSDHSSDHTLTCLNPAQQAMSRMKGGKKMTLAVSVMGRRPPNHLVKEGIQGRKPAPAHDTAWHSTAQQETTDHVCDHKHNSKPAPPA
jgi:hypothetical protein